MRYTLAVLILLALGGSAHAAVTLPIEVMGPAGTVESATVTVPSGQGAMIDGLWLQAHNLEYPNPAFPQTEASVQVNNSDWIPLNNTTAQFNATQKGYGGIGGSFHTVKFIVALPAGTVVDGNNVINFRFEQTDGSSSGYRVLKLNFTSGGTPVLPESAFSYDTDPANPNNPQNWTAPAGGNAANGQLLWQGSKPLVQSALPNAPMIGARCMDCHTQDGRDLKYFNYSNFSIEQRAQFHGLSAQDGLDLAAYIRSLNVYQSQNGRPWNPPYQPGPGLDERPLAEWAAGAGIDWVLDTDQQTLPYLFPNNNITKTVISPNTETIVREIPIEMQFPDWNHWLPKTHPMDAFPAWTASSMPTQYQAIRNMLLGGARPSVNGTTGYEPVSAAFGQLGYSQYVFQNTVNGQNTPVTFTPVLSRHIYDLGLWVGVKTWEMMHEFDLEHYGQTIFGNLGEPRSWFESYLFDFSPNLLKIPRDSTGVNGDGHLTTYLSAMWYQVQMTVYGGNRWDLQRPMDWGYTWGFFKDLAGNDPIVGSGVPSIMRMILDMVKGGQMTSNGLAPTNGWGWNPEAAMAAYTMEHYAWQGLWSDTPPSTRTQIEEAFLGAWMDKNTQFQLKDYTSDLTGFQAGQYGVVDPTWIVARADVGNLADQMWYTVPLARTHGISEALLNHIIDWMKTLYPLSAWDLLRNTNVTNHLWIYLDSITVDTNTVTLQPVFDGIFQSAFGTLPAQLDVYLNDQVKLPGEALPVSPGNNNYMYVWQNVPPGTYTVSVRAVYPQGQISSDRRTITVTGNPGPNRPPVVAWAVPSQSETLVNGSSITLIAKAFDFDPNDGIAKMDFYADSNLLTEMLPSPGQTFVGANWNGDYGWVWNNLTTGTHILTAVATDTQGAQTTSAPITINVLSSTLCDLNQDGRTDVLDVQLAVNQVLIPYLCGNADLNQNNQCDVTDVQRIVNAAAGGQCIVP